MNGQVAIIEIDGFEVARTVVPEHGRVDLSEYPGWWDGPAAAEARLLRRRPADALEALRLARIREGELLLHLRGVPARTP